MNIIITGASGSGKTTVQDILIREHNFARPYNFTTRSPRSDKELDEYIFLSEDQYFKKLKNGDFAEFTYYNGNFYAVSNTNSSKGEHTCVILEPVGRVALEKNWIMEEREMMTFHFMISEEEQEKRLGERGDSIADIKKRKTDLKWFYPRSQDIVIMVDNKSPEEIVKEILYFIEQSKSREEFAQERIEEKKNS